MRLINTAVANPNRQKPSPILERIIWIGEILGARFLED